MNEQIIMHLDNLAEEEREQFTKLLEKANKENRVWKPKKIDQYYYINDFTDVCTDTWQEAGADYKRFKIGNVYKTREEVCFALERAKVKAELKRYALEHNDPEKEAWNNDNGHYMIAFNHRVNDLFITRGYYIEEESATCFTSAPIARDAIEAVGEERILKYIFGVEVGQRADGEHDLVLRGERIGAGGHFVVHDLVGYSHTAQILFIRVGGRDGNGFVGQVDAEDLTGPARHPELLRRDVLLPLR